MVTRLTMASCRLYLNPPAVGDGVRERRRFLKIACETKSAESLEHNRDEYTVFCYRALNYRRAHFMNWTRRDFLKTALALPAGAWLANYGALAAPYAKMVKITAIKTLQ